MKTLILVLIVAVASFSQGVMTSSVVDGAYEVYLDTVLGTSATDSLAAADSSTLCTKFPADNNLEYILVRDAFTGTGSDSVSVQVRSDAYDADGNFLYSVVTDSFTTSAGESILLTWNRTQVAYSYTLKLIGYGDDGGQLITNRLQLWKRRPYLTNRNWTGVR